MKFYFLGAVTILLVVTSSSILAASSYQFHRNGVRVFVEPVIGYELFRPTLPAPRVQHRLFYGGRMTALYRWFGLEAEGTWATDSTAYTYPSIFTAANTTYRLKMGLLGSFQVHPRAGVHLRAGLDVLRNRSDEIRSTGTLTTWQPFRYSPYAGAGAIFNLFWRVLLRADATLVFPQFPSLFDLEPQVSVGLGMGF